jgi:hypothetical protein
MSKSRRLLRYLVGLVALAGLAIGLAVYWGSVSVPSAPSSDRP